MNLLIATLVSGGIAGLLFSHGFGSVVGGFVGIVSFGCFAGIIYLRGYLLPGTPWLTRTYLPERLLKRFDKHSPPRNSEFDTEQFLLDHEAIEECVDKDDLCLTDEFRTAWHQQMESLSLGDRPSETLAELFDVDPARLDIDEHGSALVARLDGGRVAQWESPAAFLADMAGARVLRERAPDWASFTVERRGIVLNGLRLFLDSCPACGGSVALKDEVITSCCRSMDVVAMNCQDCETRLLEVDVPS